MRRPWFVLMGVTMGVALVSFGLLLLWSLTIAPVTLSGTVVGVCVGALWIAAGLTDGVGALAVRHLAALGYALLGTWLLAWAAAFVAVAGGVGTPHILGVLAAIAGGLSLAVGVDWLRGGRWFGQPGT